MSKALRVIVGCLLIAFLAACGNNSINETRDAPTLSTAAIGQLNNGVPKYNLSGVANSWKDFALQVPAGARNLKFTISGGTGDADLYVRYGGLPSLSSYNCRNIEFGNNATCTFAAPRAGTYYVSLFGYSRYSGVKLVGQYQTATSSGISGRITSSRNIYGTYVAACYNQNCENTRSKIIQVTASGTNVGYRVPVVAGNYAVVAIQDTNNNGYFDDPYDRYAVYPYLVTAPASNINLRLVTNNSLTAQSSKLSVKGLDALIAKVGK